MAEEEWDFVDGLKSTRSSCVCMTCQHFSYVCDQHCHTLPAVFNVARSLTESISPRGAATGWSAGRRRWVGARRSPDERGMVDRRRRPLDMALLA